MQDDGCPEWDNDNDVSQFPECGMNLCRVLMFPIHQNVKKLLSQFPECGMNLCRNDNVCDDKDNCPCLNSLNAG